MNKEKEKMKKKLLSLLMVAAMAVTMTACSGGNNGADGSKDAKKEKLVIAYQSSIAYAPLIVMQEKGLIEKHFDGELEVDWQLLANGAAINDGITAGSIDVGAMGAAPALTGMQAGIPYKIFTGLSSQPYAILTNKENIKSLKDITADDQIAITNINSHPHILLAMAAKAELGDAHALDGNLVVLANADGYSSIISGAVQCHMVISPYNFMEDATEGINEIAIGKDVWPNGNTFIVGVASTKLQEEKPEVYKALCDATEEAMTFIKENPEETAQILAKGYDASAEEIATWMSDERSSYTSELQGVMELSNFMVEEGFLEKGPKDIKEIVFDNVKGN